MAMKFMKENVLKFMKSQIKLLVYCGVENDAVMTS